MAPGHSGQARKRIPEAITRQEEKIWNLKDIDIHIC